jgi:hypothetical protein
VKLKENVRLGEHNTQRAFCSPNLPGGFLEINFTEFSTAFSRLQNHRL